MKRLDCVIASLPFIEYYLPPAAPAVLKGHLEHKGFTVQTLDLNINVKETFENNNLVIASSFFHANRGDTTFQPELLEQIDTMIDGWVDRLLAPDPRYIGLSVFSFDSRVACEIVVQKLKEKKHNSKIFIGGMGLSGRGDTNDEDWLEDIKPYIDYYIIGEGELACENLLKGNFTFPGINSKAPQIKDLSDLGPADYKDYDLSSYEQFYSEKQIVQITGSRGCVRNCTFCNVNTHWPSFTWRTSESIIKEMQMVYETHGISDFFFTDSLINGNLKVYMEMVEGLANFNYKTDAKITWGGQYIVRKNKNLSKDYFTLTRDSGARNLALGVESGSNNVLAHIRKGVTREDLDEFIENFDKHDITCSYQMIIGYPTETDKDFEETLDLFYDHQKYVASGTIHGASLLPMSVTGGTPLAMDPNPTFERISDLDSTWGWVSTAVPGLDWPKRLERRIIAQEVCDMLQWPTVSADRNLGNLFQKHESYIAWTKGTTSTSILKQPDLSFLS